MTPPLTERLYSKIGVPTPLMRLMVTAAGMSHSLQGRPVSRETSSQAFTRSNREKMKETDRPSCELTADEQPVERQEENEEKLTWTEIDIEEVAIDGICGVY